MAEGGHYTYLRTQDGLYRSPVGLVGDAGFPEGDVFVLDLDGLERDSPDLGTVRRIAARRDVWLEAGTADADAMMDLFVSDASKVVLGTLTLRTMDVLADALQMSEDVVFSIAWDGAVLGADPEVAGRGAGPVLDKVAGLGLRDGILMDLGSIRNRTAVDLAAVSALSPGFERLYVSGHVTGQDMGALEAAGAAGAIIDFRTLGGILDERA